jgi:putative transcriptional regulator
MDKQHFDQLVKGLREMKRHMAGKPVRGASAPQVDEPDVRAIREAAKVSQSQFAELIGVNLRMLQDWKRRRTKPTGPARALLNIVASNPKSAIEALHASSQKLDGPRRPLRRLPPSTRLTHDSRPCPG